MAHADLCAAADLLDLLEDEGAIRLFHLRLEGCKPGGGIEVPLKLVSACRLKLCWATE